MVANMCKCLCCVFKVFKVFQGVFARVILKFILGCLILDKKCNLSGSNCHGVRGMEIM